MATNKNPARTQPTPAQAIAQLRRANQVAEDALRQGHHPEENPTLDLPCREVFARGQKAIEVIGPVAEVEEEIAALHQRFWHAARSA